MKLTISSSWGNGHAVSFFERDVPYYAAYRDLVELSGGRLYLYPEWDGVLPLAEQELAGADAAVVTSYCPDGIVASDVVLSSPARPMSMSAAARLP